MKKYQVTVGGFTKSGNGDAEVWGTFNNEEECFKKFFEICEDVTAWNGGTSYVDYVEVFFVEVDDELESVKTLWSFKKEVK